MGQKMRQYNKKGIFLSIWKNKGLCVSIQRLYKDGEGTPRFTNNFRTFDLVDLENLIQEVREDLKKRPI